MARRRASQLEQAPAKTSLAETPVMVQPSIDPLQRHRDVRTMPEAELRAYALQVGVSRRDAESLAVDRLRHNCVLMIQQHIESL